MEAINNMASAAGKAIWGENKTNETSEEPQSGVQGDTSKGEPFDGGNMDSTKTTATTGDTTSDPSVPATNPAAEKDSSHMTGDSTKAQNDVRDPSNPDTNPEHSAAKKDVDDSGTGPNPTEPKGPGPKPVEQLAREHGGDAGAVGRDSAAKTEETSGGDADNKAAPKPAGGATGGDGDGPQTESHGEGTGEKVVKASGFKADGGDFDAAAAGAGSEADRLAHEKGMDIGGDNHGKVEETPDSSSSPGKEKKSLSERIKAKLHKK